METNAAKVGEEYEVEELNLVVGQNIMGEAARRRMTQQQLADALGISRASVSGRYTGRTSWTIVEMAQVARLFGMEPADLMKGKSVGPVGLEPTTYGLWIRPASELPNLPPCDVIDLAGWRAERAA